MLDSVREKFTAWGLESVGSEHALDLPNDEPTHELIKACLKAPGRKVVQQAMDEIGVRRRRSAHRVSNANHAGRYSAST